MSLHLFSYFKLKFNNVGILCETWLLSKKKKNLRSSNTGPQFPWQQLVGNKQELSRWG